MKISDFLNRLWRKAFCILSIASCVIGLAPIASYSQSTSFPQKPITLIVPYTAGGGVDSIARLIVPLLSERLGQRVVIENKPGVSGMVGAQYVAKANPDGYTLLAGNTTTNATNYYLTKNSGYHPIKDLNFHQELREYYRQILNLRTPLGEFKYEDAESNRRFDNALFS